MVRSRALREGSVGLLIVAGVGLFLGLAAWLRNISLGRTSYSIWVEFEDVAGLKEGTPVNFRGVQIGSVRKIDVSNSLATARLEINRLDLKIPRDSFVSAQSSALIGDTSLDIDPLVTLDGEDIPGPLSKDCSDSLILCDGSHIRGEKVATLTDLIIAMDELASLLGDADLVASLKNTAANAATATQGITKLTGNLSRLSDSVQGEVGTLSNTLKSAGRAADSAQVAARSIDSAANQFGTVATQASGLADKTSTLVGQASTLIEENRVALAKTLSDIGLASNTLRITLLELQPTFASIRTSDIVSDVAQLSKNMRVASANLRVASAMLNDPQNVLLLQQTLDSARVTFTNAQKITSDLDEVTGDPKFRSNVLRLINGLSGLISSTQQLDQQIAQALSDQPMLPSQAQRMTQMSQQLDQASLALTEDLMRVAQLLEQAEMPEPSELSEKRDPTIAPVSP
ncbi:MAG: MCE family protein [Synechococcales cyanobacterium CRU_2_2]|nr:MCE family protein [Synechococcales cyanobacterium CRU_2_2]